MRYAAIGFVLACLWLTPASAQAQVHVDIGINLPGPPVFAVVPGTPVYYAPDAPADVFRYGHQYYAFTGGGWYVGNGYNGPWVVVAPQFVPAPLLRVPVRYYHVPPGHWQAWRKNEPPHWEREWGRDWDDHRKGWRGPHGGRDPHRG
jgi:hypothetical protein